MSDAKVIIDIELKDKMELDEEDIKLLYNDVLNERNKKFIEFENLDEEKKTKVIEEYKSKYEKLPLYTMEHFQFSTKSQQIEDYLFIIYTDNSSSYSLDLEIPTLLYTDKVDSYVVIERKFKSKFLSKEKVEKHKIILVVYNKDTKWSKQ